jgi:hypothetical protein
MPPVLNCILNGAVAKMQAKTSPAICELIVPGTPATAGGMVTLAVWIGLEFFVLT